MRIPDAFTIDALCAEEGKIPPCEDHNCDGCILLRSMIYSKRCGNLVYQILDSVTEDIITSEGAIFEAMSLGFRLGQGFEKLGSKNEQKSHP